LLFQSPKSREKRERMLVYVRGRVHFPRREGAYPKRDETNGCLD
jgi:hypothetical protein